MKNIKKSHKMKGDRSMQIISTVILLFLLIVVGYPVIYVISASFSSAEALSTGQVLLWPVDFTLEGYHFVMKYRTVWIGFRNSIFYTIAGVSLTMFLTVLCAYPLSRPDYQGRKVITVVFLVTMMVAAGLIPNFLVRSKLGLVGSPIAVILCGTISVSQMIILRTAFNSIPRDLYEAATIDGANDFQILWHVSVALSKATISVIVLYSMVGNWNEYFNSMIYVRNSELWPLQMVLRNILTGVQSIDTSTVTTDLRSAARTNAEQIQYALIIIATVPVLLAYALTQKNFKKGVMVGSVKG